MNEAGFLAAIAEDPTDETTLLVFADWLEEQGDPRAGWIRDKQIRPWMGSTMQSPILALIESLTKTQRVIAVRQACARIGAPIVPALVELFGHENPSVRWQAGQCLRIIGKAALAAVPALLAALKDPDQSVCEVVVKALKDIKPAQDTDPAPLRAALNDEDHTVRRVASQVLGSMRATTGVARELRDQLRSTDPVKRASAIEALAALGLADAVSQLAVMLDDPVASVRSAAVRAMGQVTVAGAIGPLCRALQDADPAVRQSAADQLDGRHTPTEEVIASLRTALHDSSPEVRRSAVYALGRYGQRAASAIPELVRNVSHDVTEVRLAAITALVTVGTDDFTALAGLVPAIDDADSTVAMPAVKALSCWTHWSREAAEALRRYLRRAQTGEGWELDSEWTEYFLRRLEPFSSKGRDKNREAGAGENETWPAGAD
jgi:uncharacterized protein (TIGR02996 family)